MGEWCVNQHGKSGLTQACLDAPLSHEEVEKEVTDYIKKWIPERGAGILAGSSVHADMRCVDIWKQERSNGLMRAWCRFLLKGMPGFMSHLSYRIVGEYDPSWEMKVADRSVDVSSISVSVAMSARSPYS
jgi:oligoribonuclease